MALSSFRTFVKETDRTGDRAAIDSVLDEISDSISDVPDRVVEAIRYSLTGGKRFRGRLVLAAYRAAGGSGDASPLAASVEVVHAYSLIHDDLPCMDDDAVRRGRPTVHVAFGVAAATAAGLAMVPLAIGCAMKARDALGLNDEAMADAIQTLMRASGGGGMIGGQLLDLEGEGKPLELGELERIHRGKTGSLIAAAARLGGLAANVGASQLLALEEYGRSLGLAFQIIDDVLDVTGTSAQLGKTAGKDVAVAKATYPALLGVEGARVRARQLVEQGCDRLSSAALLTSELSGIAHFTISRRS
jgi:geranylgeranyl diphosphate synthase, type II